MTELLSRQHQNNVTKEEYNLLFCYKKLSIRNTNQQHYKKSIYIFCWSFVLFHQRIVITVTFKMLLTFCLKRQSKRCTIIKLCSSNNSNGKDLTVLFKMGWSRKLICKINWYYYHHLQTKWWNYQSLCGSYKSASDLK